jgi:hypothetical protein
VPISALRQNISNEKYINLFDEADANLHSLADYVSHWLQEAKQGI